VPIFRLPGVNHMAQCEAACLPTHLSTSPRLSLHIMTVSTFSAAVHITPSTLRIISERATIHVALAIIKTFYTHGRRRAKKLKDGDEKEEATDDIFFDEYVSEIAFDILLTKAFQSISHRQIIHSSGYK
jgi:hypothetical protein